MRKALPFAGSQQQQFRIASAQALEIFSRESVEARHMPRFDRLVGREENREQVADLIDFNKAGAVGGDGIERSRRIRVQFQFAPGFLAIVSLKANDA